MAAKTPIRTVYTGGNPTGLAEFQSGEFIDYQVGGTGVTALGTAGQVLKVNSGATALEWGGVEAILNIEGLPDGTGVTLAGTDKLALSDGGTEKQVNISQLSTFTETLTNKTLSGSSNTLSNIGNSSLTNSAVTVGSTSISLGASATTLAGITNLTAGGINITGNSITSADSTIIEMGEGLSVTGNLTVSGDMTVSGTTTSLATTNTAVTDNLLELNSGVGANSDDSGIIIERGSTGDNAILFWDESADKFVVGTTSATAASNGNLSHTKADFEGAKITGTEGVFTNTGVGTVLTVNGTDDGTGEGPVMVIKRNSASPADSDKIGVIAFKGENDSDQAVTYAKIKAEIADASDGTEDGLIDFKIMKDGTSTSTVKMDTDSLFLQQNINLKFEGSNANANETTLTVTDPTTDRTLTLPDETGTLATQGYVTTQIQTKDNTDEITEGSTNLYYTNARADARIANNIIDEDAMGTDSATRAPSQQSVKAFVASQILTKDNTDEITEGSTNLYYTNARADARITNALKDEDNMASNSATHLASQQSIKAYVDAQTTDEVRQDIVGAMLTGNTETLITVTYQDGDGTVDFVVDNNLANYDNSSSAFLTAVPATTNANLIADGTISNTEYQHLNGVSSNVQTQLNTKASSSQSIAFALALG